MFTLERILLSLLFFFTIASPLEASDYIKWGTLDNGGIKSKVDYPKKFSTISNCINVNPKSYGKQLNFSIYVKSTNVLTYAKLWIRFDGDNGELKLQHGDKIIGTNNRKIYTLTTIPVPVGAKYICFGVFLMGSGEIEVSNYNLQ